MVYLRTRAIALLDSAKNDFLLEFRDSTCLEHRTTTLVQSPSPPVLIISARPSPEILRQPSLSVPPAASVWPGVYLGLFQSVRHRRQRVLCRGAGEDICRNFQLRRVQFELRIFRIQGTGDTNGWSGRGRIVKEFTRKKMTEGIEPDNRKDTKAPQRRTGITRRWCEWTIMLSKLRPHA